MNDIDQRITFGLSKLKNKRGKVQLTRSEYMYLFNTFQELVSFFHQPTHYPDIKSINRFLGNRKRGAFKAIAHCHYKILSKRLPDDIRGKVNDGEFDCENTPFYFKMNRSLTSR